MLARARAHLTYANVVATLALFVALGGSAYAAIHIGSRQIKNRSIRQIDVHKNTLGGTEINESKLKTVPRARNAANAAAALNARNAANAAQATNANSLGGQGVSAFEKSSRTQFGNAPLSPAGVPDEKVLLSWPESGAQLKTIAGNGPCVTANGEIGIRFSNTNSSGPGLRLFAQGDDRATIPPNGNNVQCGGQNNYVGSIADSTGRTLFFQCLSVDGELRCLGTRSQP
jgi:hypothetical protein